MMSAGTAGLNSDVSGSPTAGMLAITQKDRRAGSS